MTAGPGVGVSEREASAGNLFDRQDPGKEKKHKRKKKKASKGGTGGGVSEMVGTGSPTLTKRNHSGGSSRRELKKGNWMKKTAGTAER